MLRSLHLFFFRIRKCNPARLSTALHALAAGSFRLRDKFWRAPLSNCWHWPGMNLVSGQLASEEGHDDDSELYGRTFPATDDGNFPRTSMWAIRGCDKPRHSQELSVSCFLQNPASRARWVLLRLPRQRSQYGVRLLCLYECVILLDTGGGRRMCRKRLNQTISRRS